MARLKYNGKFHLIVDTLGVFALVALVLLSVATSALSLIFRPDREPWRVGLDVFILVMFAVLVFFATKLLRRALKNLDAEEAEAAEIRRMHTDHAENVTLPRIKANMQLKPEYRAKIDEIVKAHPELLDRRDPQP